MYLNGEMKNAQLEKFTTATKPAGVESQIGYNTTTKHPEFYNGNTWVDLMVGNGGMQNPANTLFVSSVFNNTSPYYSTIDNALASTSSDVTLVIFPGTHYTNFTISSRSVSFVCVGLVNIACGTAYQCSISSGNLYIYGKGARVYFYSHGLSMSDSNMFCNVKEYGLDFSMNNGNVYIDTDMYTCTDTIVHADSSYSTSFRLTSKACFNNSNTDSKFKFYSDGSGGIFSSINIMNGRCHFDVTDSVKLDINNGEFLHTGTATNLGNSFINTTGQGFAVRINGANIVSTSQSSYPFISMNGSASTGTVDARGCKFKNTSFASHVYSASPNSRASFYNTIFITSSPGTLPFGTGIPNQFLYDSTTKYDQYQF